MDAGSGKDKTLTPHGGRTAHPNWSALENMRSTEENRALRLKGCEPWPQNIKLYMLYVSERGFLADAPSRLPEHPPGVLPELCQRHAHVALRLHPCYGPQDVVHVPGESLEENARAFVEGDDESRLRDQLGSRLGLGFVGVVVDRPAEWAGGGRTLFWDGARC